MCVAENDCQSKQRSVIDGEGEIVVGYNSHLCIVEVYLQLVNTVNNTVSKRRALLAHISVTVLYSKFCVCFTERQWELCKYCTKERRTYLCLMMRGYNTPENGRETWDVWWCRSTHTYNRRKYLLIPRIFTDKKIHIKIRNNDSKFIDIVMHW